MNQVKELPVFMKKNGLRKISLIIGSFLILSEFLILVIILFDDSPIDWSSLLPSLIIMPISGFALLMFGKGSMNKDLSFEKQTPTRQPKMINHSTTNEPLFKPNDILCMAVVYEGYLPIGHVLNNAELATEIMTSNHAIGSLNNVRLSKETLVQVQRANENAYYQGDYAPKDDLPIMIQNLHKQLRIKMMANGDQVDRLNVKNLMFKSHSQIAGTLWVQLTVLSNN
jgi:hypothetical protein